MFFTRERSNHNFPNSFKHRVSKCTCTTNIYGGSAREGHQSKLIMVVLYFSADGILLYLCVAKMKIYKRSLQGLLSSTLTALLLALVFSCSSLHTPYMESLLAGYISQFLILQINVIP